MRLAPVDGRSMPPSSMSYMMMTPITYWLQRGHRHCSCTSHIDNLLICCKPWDTTITMVIWSWSSTKMAFENGSCKSVRNPGDAVCGLRSTYLWRQNSLVLYGFIQTHYSPALAAVYGGQWKCWDGRDAAATSAVYLSTFSSTQPPPCRVGSTGWLWMIFNFITGEKIKKYVLRE